MDALKLEANVNIIKIISKFVGEHNYTVQNISDDQVDIWNNKLEYSASIRIIQDTKVEMAKLLFPPFWHNHIPPGQQSLELDIADPDFFDKLREFIS